MAAAGYTPLLIYGSTTASNTPLAANLTTSASGVELAINAADGKLFYKDSGGTVQVLATKGTGPIGGSNTQVQYNSSGALAGSANLTFDGTTLTANALTTTSTVTINGGTANGVAYLNGSKVLTTGSALTFDGTNFATTGTASATKLIPTGGAITGNGMYLPAANSVAITTNGTQAIYIDSSQNVGLGTSTPNSRLQLISATSSATVFSAANTSATGYGMYLQGGTLGNYLIYAADYAGTIRFFVDGGGNVGIGTSSPSYPLHLNSAASLTSIGLTGGASGATNYKIMQGVSGVSNSGFSIYDLTNSATRLVIDSSGNLGLGVTPSAWNSDYRTMQFGATGLLYGRSGGEVAFGTNWYRDSGATFRYLTSAAATYQAQAAGIHYWFTAASGTAGNTITFTQAMTLDASGNLVVGGTSAVYNNSNRGNISINGASTAILALSTGGSGRAYLYSDGSRLDLLNTQNDALTFGTNNTERARIDSSGNLGVGTTSPTSIANYKTVTVNGTTGGLVDVASNGTVGARIQCDTTYPGMALFALTNNPMVFGTNSLERARITSGGDLLVGDTTLVDSELLLLKKNTGTKYVERNWNPATTGDNGFVVFGTEAAFTGRGSITYNRAGGLVSFNTTSDYRAKEVYGPVQNSGEQIDALKVYRGKMLGATQERPMMIAHEAQEVVPYAVGGEKDAVNKDGTPNYQTMDHQILVPLLIAELQSLRARVAQLESKGA